MNLLRQDEGTLHHLMQTVFFSYVVNSFALLVGVVGTCAVGVGAAWLVVLFRFPGRKIFEWSLGIASRHPGLYYRLCLC